MSARIWHHALLPACTGELIAKAWWLEQQPTWIARHEGAVLLHKKIPLHGGEALAGLQKPDTPTSQRHIPFPR